MASAPPGTNEDGANGETGVLVVTATGRRIVDYEWRPPAHGAGSEGPSTATPPRRPGPRWDALRGSTDLAP